MADPARRRATYEDLLAVPDRYVAEIIGGALHTQARPAPRHALAGSSLGGVMGARFHRGEGGPGGWWILGEPELHLADGDVLVPDVAGWRVERMPELPETAWFELAPDWVCEVLSPSTQALDRADKRAAYLAAGVSWIWLVDPLARTLEAFASDAGAWRLLGTWRDEAEVRAAPFDAVPLDLGVLWRAPARPAT